MTKKLKKRLKRILLGAGAFAAVVILNWLVVENSLLKLLLYLIPYAVIGGDVLKKAVTNIARGQVFDENFLMAIATVGAFCIGEYPEAVAVMLFYQVGEFFQSYAVNRSRKSISSLMDIRPDYAVIKRGNEEERVEPESVKAGDIIIVKPGEKVPLDGRVVNGSTSLDTRALTGESLPREAVVDDYVISGCININGLIEVEVTKEFGESTVAKILDLVENSSSKKAEVENFITKFARYYTPIVVISAAVLAVLPPLLLPGASWADWIYRALSFLVISCPCALVISIPLSFFGGLGGASKKGILVKGSNYLEALADTEIVVFDKTGTLTKGNFQVSEIHGEGISEDQLLELAAYAESYSNHPISVSLKQAYNQNIDSGRITDVEEIAGEGVKAVIDGKTVYAGNARLMNRIGVGFTEADAVGTVVYLAEEKSYKGYIMIADQLKADAKKAIDSLKNDRVKDIVMLTGDSKKVGEHVAGQLGLKRFFAELLPADKVDRMEELFANKSEKGKLVFVGDGINDAPVLARADIGVAMGGLGSDAAIEAADVVIMTDEPSKVSQAIHISKRTLAIVRQNIVFALGIKIFVLLLAALGIVGMWAAVFADVGVSVIAILNAMRALK